MVQATKPFLAEEIAKIVINFAFSNTYKYVNLDKLMMFCYLAVLQTQKKYRLRNFFFTVCDGDGIRNL
jgi:hypothetical protein